jgi:hypothetical protein
MKGRRGVSLAELLLTMSACTVILTMSAGLIHRALHAQSRSRGFIDDERSALRLGEAFRRDVHSATDVEITSANEAKSILVKLQFPGSQSVIYQQGETGRVERTLQADGNVKSREAFDFAAEARLTVEKAPPRLVVLSIESLPVASSPADSPTLTPYSRPVSLRVAAVLGRHASLVKAADAAEESP